MFKRASNPVLYSNFPMLSQALLPATGLHSKGSLYQSRESISDLPSIQKSHREKTFMEIPPVMRILQCATSNGDQRVQVLIPVVQGLSQRQRQSKQHYFELVDWQELKLPSAERRQRDSAKSFERSVEVCTDWIRPKKEPATLGEELPPADLLPAKRKQQSPDPATRNARRKEFGRRALAGGGLVVMSTDCSGTR